METLRASPQDGTELMNFALPFHKGDKDQAARWLAWVEELGGFDLNRHKLFIMPAKGQEADFQTALPFEIVKDSAGIVSDWSEGPDLEVRDASGANSMIRQFAWHFWFIKKGPWMFIEPDCIPLRPTWANELEDEYKNAGKPFMAAFVPEMKDVYPAHPSGNMILPQNAAELSQGLMLPQNVRVFGHEERLVEWAFDMACARDVLQEKRFHETKLIQHVFRGPSFEIPDDLNRIDPAACVFHSDKNGGLMERFRERARGITQQPASLETVPKREARVIHTYFEDIQTKDAKEQRAILEYWQQHWREQGWEPRVLGREEAKQHPLYREYYKEVVSRPTVNAPDYEAACWLRWLAMSVVGGGYLTDYDVLGFGYTAESPTGLTFFDPSCVPCFVLGRRVDYEDLIAYLMAYDWSNDKHHNAKHTSDMYACNALTWNKHLPYLHRNLLVQYRNEGFEKAVLVHFSHSSMPGENRLTKMKEAVTVREMPEPEEAFEEAPVTVLTEGELIESLLRIAKRSGIDKGRIVKRLKKAGLVPK